jgi:DNA-binding MarR family transcriptional regulator
MVFEVKPLLRAIRFVQEFRKLDSEMQMQTALVFLMIAKHEGCQLRDLEREAGLSSASVSRNVAALSQLHRKGRAGHGLVIAKVSPEDRRNRQLYLTAKGRSVLETLSEGV